MRRSIPISSGIAALIFASLACSVPQMSTPPPTPTATATPTTTPTSPPLPTHTPAEPMATLVPPTLPPRWLFHLTSRRDIMWCPHPAVRSWL